LRAFLLSPGNVADVKAAPEWLAMIAPPCDLFLGDAAYDAKIVRNKAEEAGAKAVIPNHPVRKNPYPFDPGPYRARNAIERMFCRLKDFRRIATRYDRLAINFASAVALVSVILWRIN